MLNFSAAQLNEAQKTVAEKKLSTLVSSQDEYSLVARNIEREMLPAIERHGMGELPYFPLASGLLTGKYRMGQPAPSGSRLAQKQALADKYHTAVNPGEGGAPGAVRDKTGPHFIGTGI